MSVARAVGGEPSFTPVRRFSVQEYHRMGQAGVLSEDDRVELLEGWIVEKVNHNPQHDSSVDLAHEALNKHVPAGWRIRIQSAITTSDSEPEPDLAVVRGAARDFATRHPGPEEIGLVVEVADSSLRTDRRKRRLYARAGIGVYWIVNLVDRRLEVYSDPTDEAREPRYRLEQQYSSNDRVPLVIAGRQVGSVAVSDLLP